MKIVKSESNFKTNKLLIGHRHYKLQPSLFLASASSIGFQSSPPPQGAIFDHQITPLTRTDSCSRSAQPAKFFFFLRRCFTEQPQPWPKINFGNPGETVWKRLPVCLSLFLVKGWSLPSSSVSISLAKHHQHDVDCVSWPEVFILSQRTKTTNNVARVKSYF